MSTRRVILGNLGGGTYGLRVSLPGHDVVTEGDAVMSFDSDWTDILKYIQVGIATKTADYSFTDVFFTDPGYQPFAEVRFRSGLTVYDDYSPLVSTATSPHGLGASILTDRIKLWPVSSGSAIAYDVTYAIMRVAVPNP